MAAHPAASTPARPLSAGFQYSTRRVLCDAEDKVSLGDTSEDEDDDDERPPAPSSHILRIDDFGTSLTALEAGAMLQALFAESPGIHLAAVMHTRHSIWLTFESPTQGAEARIMLYSSLHLLPGGAHARVFFDEEAEFRDARNYTDDLWFADLTESAPNAAPATTPAVAKSWAITPTSTPRVDALATSRTRAPPSQDFHRSPLKLKRKRADEDVPRSPSPITPLSVTPSMACTNDGSTELGSAQTSPKPKSKHSPALPRPRSGPGSSASSGPSQPPKAQAPIAVSAPSSTPATSIVPLALRLSSPPVPLKKRGRRAGKHNRLRQ
ncbi:hypothetical protein B0H12DRAFT_1233635 [Mycena haematopus]|nr:hypothetical protein B0H12DRAFT_1233635 [Mycena haematopus]